MKSPLHHIGLAYLKELGIIQMSKDNRITWTLNSNTYLLIGLVVMMMMITLQNGVCKSEY